MKFTLTQELFRTKIINTSRYKSHIRKKVRKKSAKREIILSIHISVCIYYSYSLEKKLRSLTSILTQVFTGLTKINLTQSLNAMSLKVEYF